MSVGLLACGGSLEDNDPGDNAGAEGGGLGDTPGHVPGKGDVVDGNRGGASGTAGGGQEPAEGTGGNDEGAGAAAGNGGGDQPKDSVKVRIVAANLTSGNHQSYALGHGQRILQGLRPDVVLIQEFTYEKQDGSDLGRFVTETFGPEFTYFRGDTLRGPAHTVIPNGVISRYPILRAGDWKDPQVSNRNFTWAEIDLPGPKDLFAVSLHLLTGKSSRRIAETKEIMARLNKEVPDHDHLVVIGGDFNTRTRGDSSLHSFRARFKTDGPYPVCNLGRNGTNATRLRPYDWILPNHALAGFEVPVVIGENSFTNGLVFDSRVYQPLRDVAPVQLTDSGADSMEHMAVVRDFLID